MLKFYKPTIDQMLLLAIYERDYVGHSLQDIAERVRHQGFSASPAGRRQADLFNGARKSVVTDKSASLNELIDLLFKKLDEDVRGRGEQDLVDRIVQVLQLPYARNTLSGDTLRRLRQAILLPGEMGGLMARLERKEMSCINCGQNLHMGESVTITQNEHGETTLSCHRCSTPTSVSCASCHEAAPLSAKAQTAMARMQCPKCQEKGMKVGKGKGEEKEKEGDDAWAVFRTAAAQGIRAPQAAAPTPSMTNQGPLEPVRFTTQMRRNPTTGQAEIVVDQANSDLPSAGPR